MTAEVIPIFVFGLFVGSFLNVLIYRLPKNKGFLLGRSYCDNCKKNLFWYDLIPVVSYLFLKGKCRFCKNKINWQIPVVELITGILFILVFVKFSASNIFQLSYYLFLVSSFIAIFFIDLKNGIIPDKIVYLALAVSLLFVIFYQDPVNHILSGVSAFIIFLLLNFFTRGRGMGVGDIKLSLLLGLVLGFPKIIASLYLAFLTGGILSLILILWGKKHFKKDTIAFGPFLAISAIITIFLGDKLVSLLLSFLQ